MNFQARLRKLERALGASGVQVFFFAARTVGDEDQPFRVTRGETTWTQTPGESVADFEARVTAAALQGFRPTAREPSLFLYARRPRLTEERWLQKHGLTRGAAMCEERGRHER